MHLLFFNGHNLCLFISKCNDTQVYKCIVRQCKVSMKSNIPIVCFQKMNVCSILILTIDIEVDTAAKVIYSVDKCTERTQH